jgi:hypothetical protein
METVGAGAEYNLGTGKFTIYANICGEPWRPDASAEYRADPRRR